MKEELRVKAKNYGIFAVLAAALLISAVVAAYLRNSDDRTVVIYSNSSAAETMGELETVSSDKEKRSSKAEKTSKAERTKVTTTKKPKESKTTTSKTTKVKTTTTKSTRTDRAEDTEEIVIDFPIDINQVTFEELTAIDGVGESTADSILAFRERRGKITYMEELLEVTGIGHSKLELLERYLYVSEEDYYRPTETTTEKQTAIPVETDPPAPAPTETVTITETSSPEETDTTTEETEPPEPPEPELQPININEADAEELMEKLLIDEELAEEIIAVREQLGGEYENYLQLLYVKGISKDMLAEMKEFILLEDE